MCMYNYTCSDYVTTETLIQIVHKHASTLDTDHGFVDWLKVHCCEVWLCAWPQPTWVSC